MRLIQLLSFLLAATYAVAQTLENLPQVLARGAITPLGVGVAQSDYTENQKLYISDGVYYGDKTFKLAMQFVSLDLSTAWTSDAPVWNKLTRRQTGQFETQGTVALFNNGSSLLSFSDSAAYIYDTNTDTWDPNPYINLTYPAFSGGAVTNTDSGLIYGIESWKDKNYNASINTWRFTELNPVNMTYTNITVQGYPYPDHWTLMTYSSAAKKIFAFNDGSKDSDQDGYDDSRTTFSAFNFTSRKWNVVNTTGAIPSIRVAPCFVSAYGGKKLILAGGRKFNETQALSDAYMLDVKTSVWTRLNDAPRIAWSPVCAVTGDLFVYWGGDYVSPNESDYSSNGQGPAILNLATNTWDIGYAPLGQTPQTRSSADHMRMALTTTGLVALTLISMVISSLIL